MLICQTLRKCQREYVLFDPLNKEHLKAFEMLCIGEKTPSGFRVRQHPVLRFELEEGFQDVRSVMHYKVGLHHLKTNGKQ